MGKKYKYTAEDGDDHSDAFISKVIGSAPARSGGAPREEFQEENNSSSAWTSDIYYRLGSDEKSGKRSCLSIFVLVIAALIAVIGVGLVILGVIQKEHRVLPLCPGCSSISTVLYAAGGAVAVIGVVGILAAATRKKLFAVPFTFLLALIGVVLLVLGGGAIIYATKVGTIDLKSLWETTVASDPQLICSIQNQLECSGFQEGCCRGTSIANRNQSSSYMTQEEDLVQKKHFQALISDSATNNNTWCYYFYPNGTTVDDNNTDISWPARECATACVVENMAFVSTCSSALEDQIKKYLVPIAATGLGLGFFFLIIGVQAIRMTRQK